MNSRIALALTGMFALSVVFPVFVFAEEAPKTVSRVLMVQCGPFRYDVSKRYLAWDVNQNGRIDCDEVGGMARRSYDKAINGLVELMIAEEELRHAPDAIKARQLVRRAERLAKRLPEYEASVARGRIIRNMPGIRFNTSVYLWKEIKWINSFHNYVEGTYVDFGSIFTRRNQSIFRDHRLEQG